MPTYQPAILVNGLPIDKALVLDVIERDFDVVFSALVEWQRFTSVPYDDTHDTPTFEAVRMPRHEYHMDKDVFRGMSVKRISKRKEVK